MENAISSKSNFISEKSRRTIFPVGTIAANVCRFEEIVPSIDDNNYYHQ